MFDYEVLRLIWWVLIGILLIGFAVTDGLTFGVGALALVLGKNDTERRIMLNTIAPHWDGNQVWLITAGGALFCCLAYGVCDVILWVLRGDVHNTGRPLAKAIGA